MTLASTLTTLLPVIVILIVVSVIEIFIPLRHQSRFDHHRLSTNLALVSINLVVGLLFNGLLLAGAVYMNRQGLGLLQLLSLTGPAAILLAIVALDFSTYLAHVCLHKNIFLWRVHVVHHIDIAVDATTAYRHHPLETLFRFTFTAAMAWSLGVTPAALALYRAASALNAIFEHANIRVPRVMDRVLILFSVTPDMHKIHHSRLRRETDSNYANLFSLFDRLCGTFTPTARVHNVQYGIQGYDDAKYHSLASALQMPFSGPQIPDFDSAKEQRQS